MVTHLASKPGLSSTTTLNIPTSWDPTWFRNFISNQLKGADVRNAISGPGISITGNISSPYATISIGGTGPVALPGPVTITGGGLIVGSPTGGNEGVGTVNVSGGYYINGVNLIQTGSFTGTFTGMSGTTTGTVTWSIINGDTVMLRVSNTTGTSNSTAMTMTGLPATLEPAQTQVIPTLVVNAGNFAFGAVEIVTGSGTVVFYCSSGGLPATAGFTASGTKGLNDWSCVYKLT